MRYPDTVQLVSVTSDGYGDDTIDTSYDVLAAFIQRSGYEHENNADGYTSDAAVYLLPTDSNVLSVKSDLEGMYIVYEEEWYRITDVNIAKRKLLNNAIDNIYCRLEKVAGVPYVS